jgi:hypothetical protein
MHWLTTLRAKLRLLCPGSDFVDLVVFERREVLDDKGQATVKRIWIRAETEAAGSARSC